MTKWDGFKSLGSTAQKRPHVEPIGTRGLGPGRRGTQTGKRQGVRGVMTLGMRAGAAENLNPIWTISDPQEP